jgi:hypothetical protein
LQKRLKNQAIVRIGYMKDSLYVQMDKSQRKHVNVLHAVDMFVQTAELTIVIK